MTMAVLEACKVNYLITFYYLKAALGSLALEWASGKALDL